MTEYTAQCRISRYDRITARTDGDSVALEAHLNDGYAGETYLYPGAARIFARGILALADEIDGGETEMTLTVKIGDKVEVVDDNFTSLIGRRGTLIDIDSWDTEYPYHFREEGRSGGGVWVRAVRKVDEPADEAVPEPAPSLFSRYIDEATGLLEDTGPEPTSSPFACYVDEAKKLLTGTLHTGADVVVLAVELADRG